MSTGILALWNDCLPDYLDEYETWYAGEHLPERLGLPGWIRGRRYEAAGNGPGFFTYYEVETPEVLISSEYLERVNDPTPMTHRIMSEAFRNMSRTLCEVVRREGRMRGAWAVTQALDAGPDPDVTALAIEPGVARAEHWREADLNAPDANAESRLRGGDVTIGGCLFVETLREADARRVAATLPDARIYRFLGELEAERG